MYQIILLICLFIMGLFLPAKGQTAKNEIPLQEMLIQFEKSEKSPENLLKASAEFEKLAESDSEDWQAQYYALYVGTLNAFRLNSDDAIAESDRLLERHIQLEELNPIDSEMLTLRAFINTVKMAKEPMRYAMSLSDKIILDYRTALTLNPNNPRAMLLLAQFQMKTTEFTGGDPHKHCPNVEKAVELFKKEDKSSVKPHWGEELALEVLKNYCNQ